MKNKKKHHNYTLSLLLILITLLIAGGVTVWALRNGNKPAAPADVFSDETTSESSKESSSAEPEEEQSTEPSETSDSSEETSEESSEEESEPEPEPTMAETMLSEMTLREKLCQLIIVMPHQITGVSNQTQAGETSRQALENYPVCGFIEDATNMVSQDQVTQMNENLQSYSKIPLLITLDEEGGRVARLMANCGTTWFNSMLSYKDQGPEVARSNAATIASDILSCGFNIDLAPVADVWSNPENSVIGDRAYSDDFDQAAELVAAAVQGFHDGGTACTIKHFPGHGDTSADSHLGAVYVYKSLEDIKANELKPFKAGIEAGADCVMIGHLIITDVEDTPALFSRAIVTDLLRGELGFDGVIMTDSLQMQAMSDYYSSGEVAVMALQAGVDILLCPMDLDETLAALEAAIDSGELTEERIDESVLRILSLKEKLGLLG